LEKKRAKKPDKRTAKPGSVPIAPPPQAAETKAADAITVGWMLTVVSALLCELGAACSGWYVALHSQSQRMALLHGLLLFSAEVVGLASLLMIPVVYRVRRVPPPPSVTIGSVVIGAAPIIAAAIAAIR